MLGTLFENTAGQFHAEANYMREGFAGFRQDAGDVFSSAAGMARSFGAGMDSRLTAAANFVDNAGVAAGEGFSNFVQSSTVAQKGVGGGASIMNAAMQAAGFEPNRALPGGGMTMRGFGFDVGLSNTGQFSLETAKFTGNYLGLGASVFGYGVSLYTGGIGGLYDAAVLDVANMYNVQKFGYQEAMRYTPSGSTKVFAAKKGLTGAGVRTAGGFVGGMIGQGIGSATGIPMMGTIGAFAGSAIGAAPIRAMASNPLGLAGTVATTLAVGGAYTAMKGGAMVIKSSVKHAQAQRRMDTAGSLATFSTQGAYTMRQRAVQAMQKSHMNARSAMGREANLMHQGAMRNYHSRYR